MSADLRWKQRYDNFKKALLVFERRLKEYQDENNNEAFQMALVQSFEISFELSWKTVKDYLEYQGYEGITAPKQILRQAFQDKVISDGQAWLDALAIRNETVHVYNEVILRKVVQFASSDFKKLLTAFKKQFDHL